MRTNSLINWSNYLSASPCRIEVERVVRMSGIGAGEDCEQAGCEIFACGCGCAEVDGMSDLFPRAVLGEGTAGCKGFGIMGG